MRRNTDTELKRMGLRRDPGLYAYVISAYERSRKYMEERGIFDRISRCKKMYENDPWTAQGVHRDGDLSEVKIAIAYDIIETGLPIATGRMPVPDVDPCIDGRNQEYMQIKTMFDNATNELEMQAANEAMEALQTKLNDYAEKLQRQLIDTFKSGSLFAKLRIGYREKGIAGTFIMKSVFDPERKTIINEPVDYTTIFPSPNCDSIEAHSESGEPFCYAPIVSSKKIKKQYKIDELEYNALGDLDDTKKFRFRSEIGFAAKTQAVIKQILGATTKDKDGYCLLIECYMPDDNSEIEFQDNLYNEDGQKVYEDDGITPKNETKKRKQFPSGFKRVTVVKGHKDWILDEVDNPYGYPPFVMTKNAEQLGDFWGISDIQVVEDLIIRLNISSSNVHDNLRLTGNPKLIKIIGSQSVNKDGSIQEVTNEIGGIMETTQPRGVYYLSPPSLGVDVKWWMDFLKSWIDRITHLSDALRGFNEFSNDSGRKIQELRVAAANTFKPKLDEQVEFCHRLYQHWAWIYQNLYPEVILQKLEDEAGKAQFVEFQPQEGQQYLVKIGVAATSLLPVDVLANQELALVLFDRKITRPDGTQRGLISPEHLLDICGEAGFEDVQRAKMYNAIEQEKDDQMKQKLAVYEQFKTMAGQAAQITENGQAGQEEDQAVEQLIQMVQQVPEIIGTNEFIALPDRLKLAILAAVAQIGREGGEGGGNEQQNLNQ